MLNLNLVNLSQYTQVRTKIRSFKKKKKNRPKVAAHFSNALDRPLKIILLIGDIENCQTVKNTHKWFSSN